MSDNREELRAQLRHLDKEIASLPQERGIRQEQIETKQKMAKLQARGSQQLQTLMQQITKLRTAQAQSTQRQAKLEKDRIQLLANIRRLNTEYVIPAELVPSLAYVHTLLRRWRSEGVLFSDEDRQHLHMLDKHSDVLHRRVPKRKKNGG
jgi:seryl-tRNA synthetase